MLLDLILVRADHIVTQILKKDHEFLVLAIFGGLYFLIYLSQGIHDECNILLGCRRLRVICHER